MPQLRGIRELEAQAPSVAFLGEPIALRTRQPRAQQQQVGRRVVRGQESIDEEPPLDQQAALEVQASA